MTEEYFPDTKVCHFILTKGSKTVKYAGNQNYLAVDLVPAAIYSGTAIGDTGIAIYDSQDGYIYYNHPKHHIKNGHEKNANTNGNYKKTVRMFKWAKEKLVEKGLLRSNRAPSYFIECLLYNVPNYLFVNNFYKLEPFQHSLRHMCHHFHLQIGSYN